tara:strand:- start:3518 stop:4261 length:744 start_codon:yes stop_codon:yes gene_type:complete
MDKIKALLVKAGVKPELSGKICESLDHYKVSIREQFEKEYAAKVEQAKTVCIEETEAHKRELAKRVQIFCETKGAAIEAQLAKQSAINESEALTKLNSIVATLHGMEPNGKPSGNVTAVVEKLKRLAQVATEEKNRAVELANRKTAIAEKALKRNRELSTALQSVQEQRNGSGKKPVVEGRETVQKQGRRIDESRNSGRARSTRATLTESQDRRPSTPRSGSHVTNTGAKTGFNIDNIAAGLDEDLV